MKRHTSLFYALFFFMLWPFVVSVLAMDNARTDTRSARKLFPVKSDGKYGFIDSHGKLLIPATFDEATGFSDGLAAVAINRKWGYIDETGKIIIELKYATYGNNQFSEGLAAINEGDYSNGRWGFINTKGTVIIEPVYELAGFFMEGLAFVVSNGKRGFIDKQGDLIIEPKFEIAQWFSESCKTYWGKVGIYKQCRCICY